MALGNLVNGTWQVAGVYDPTAKHFTERSEILRWPKTGKSAPRSWNTCNPGERLLSTAGELQQCESCPKGTKSNGTRSTVCDECAPGERADFVCADIVCAEQPRCGSTWMQVTFSPNNGSSVASTATASAMCTKSILGKRVAKYAPRTRGAISTCLLVRTEARANARKVRRPQRRVLRRRLGWTGVLQVISRKPTTQGRCAPLSIALDSGEPIPAQPFGLQACEKCTMRRSRILTRRYVSSLARASTQICAGPVGSTCSGRLEPPRNQSTPSLPDAGFTPRSTLLIEQPSPMRTSPDVGLQARIST
jgi:hypothetical protein